MIYLLVSHIEDEDCDLFNFSSLEQCYKYIINNELEGYVITDITVNGTIHGFEPNDFTFIQELQ